MRTFHSYGPVDCRHHFCVQRTELVQHCAEQLVGIPDEGGHYFTIWSPRQCGKTWLMRQAAEKIDTLYPNRFTIGMMMKAEESEETMLFEAFQRQMTET